MTSSPPPLTLLDLTTIQSQLDSLAKSGKLELLVRSREAYIQALALHEPAIKQAIEKAANQTLCDAINLQREDLARFDPQHMVLSPTESLQLSPMSDYLRELYPEYPIAYCLEASLKELDRRGEEEFMYKVFSLRSSDPNVGIQVVRAGEKAYVIFFFKPGQA